MEQFLAAAIAELLKYGLPGLFIGYLIWKNHQLEVDIDAKDKKIIELMGMRVTDAIAATNAANALAGSNEKVAEALSDVDETLKRIENRIERRHP